VPSLLIAKTITYYEENTSFFCYFLAFLLPKLLFAQDVNLADDGETSYQYLQYRLESLLS